MDFQISNLRQYLSPSLMALFSHATSSRLFNLGHVPLGCLFMHPHVPLVFLTNLTNREVRPRGVKTPLRPLRHRVVCPFSRFPCRWRPIGAVHCMYIVVQRMFNLCTTLYNEPPVHVLPHSPPYQWSKRVFSGAENALFLTPSPSFRLSPWPLSLFSSWP